MIILVPPCPGQHLVRLVFLILVIITGEVNNAKKQRNTIEWERLERQEWERQENERFQGNISCQDGHNKGQKRYGPNRSRRY